MVGNAEKKRLQVRSNIDTSRFAPIVSHARKQPKPGTAHPGWSAQKPQNYRRTLSFLSSLSFAVAAHPAAALLALGSLASPAPPRDGRSMGMALSKRNRVSFNGLRPIYGAEWGKIPRPHTDPDFVAFTISGPESAATPSPNGDSWGPRSAHQHCTLDLELQHFTSIIAPLT
jgi:hypothetical protein